MNYWGLLILILSFFLFRKIFCVGITFAVAGAIMQGMTRNPLASSG